MGELEQRESVASLLLENVHKTDVAKIETCLHQFRGDSQWREIVRFEFPIKELIEDQLRYDLIIPRLLAYEVTTLSPYHYAALRGLNEILVNFIDHDIPVDVALSSGSTALHLAAFGGKIDCVQMLLDVYHADINKQDRYGWSAAHYASTEGHLAVVQLLVCHGANVSLRDQDGTSAAFRAQVNGFTDIVDYLIAQDAESLRVDTAYTKEAPLVSSPDSLYSEVWVTPKIPSKSTTLKPKNNEKHKSLPRDLKEQRCSTIRRMIRKELDNIDGDYMNPTGLLSAGDDEDINPELLVGIGANTLKGVIREELGRYTKRLFSKTVPEEDPVCDKLPDNLGDAPSPSRRNVYEDIYETVNFVPPVKKVDDVPKDAPPLPPPLPPRNFCTDVIELTDDEDITSALKLKRTTVLFASDNVALDESLKRVSALVGAHWQKLAYALPMDQNITRIKDRLSLIEKRHPEDESKRAATVLVEWRINQGDDANIDNLIIGLRKCGLKSLIEEVDKATGEYMA